MVTRLDLDLIRTLPRYTHSSSGIRYEEGVNRDITKCSTGHEETNSWLTYLGGQAAKLHDGPDLPVFDPRPCGRVAQPPPASAQLGGVAPGKGKVSFLITPTVSERLNNCGRPIFGPGPRIPDLSIQQH